MYQTILIKYPPAIGIENSVDVYYKVEPFLHHLASEHIAEKHEGYTYIGSLFDIGIRVESGEDHLDYKKLIEVNFEPENTINGFVFKFTEPDLREFNPYGIYSYSLEIYIDAYGWYQWDEEEEHHESEDEEDESITLKSYKEDKCVVCLNNEPKILFYVCVHYCVCHECEERKPFKKCPCCRTRILTKIII